MPVFRTLRTTYCKGWSLPFLVGLILALSVFSSCASEPFEEDTYCVDALNLVPINEIQVIGSHNSYRIRPPDHIMDLVTGVTDLIEVPFDPQSWDYTHVPLVEQLDQYNIRSLEIDIYRDPAGGLFYNRQGDALVGMEAASGEEILLQPGLKILHFPDFDYLSHHLNFIDALETLRLWALFRPANVPLFILVQTKEDSPAALIPGLGLTATLPFNSMGMNEIEDEIRDVFEVDMDLIITPDDLRGNYSSLREAVLDGNWPTLGESRGRIIFILMAEDDALDSYLELHPSLVGASMFTFGNPEDQETAFIKIDDPIDNQALISEKVAEGYIVRTRADADTYEARNGDYTRMMAAFSSGAQIISTDYYRFDARALQMMGWTDYEVRFPKNVPAVLNETNGPSDLDFCDVTE